jgi:two-component system sensor histidine kinase YesM
MKWYLRFMRTPYLLRKEISMSHNFWKKSVGYIYLPLRIKFIILFFILITVPFAVSGFVTYNKYTGNVEENAQSYSTQMVDQIRITLDRYVKEIERLTLSPFYDENVMNILTNHSNPALKGVYITTEELGKMNFFISSIARRLPAYLSSAMMAVCLAIQRLW